MNNTQSYPQNTYGVALVNNTHSDNTGLVEAMALQFKLPLLPLDLAQKEQHPYLELTTEKQLILTSFLDGKPTTLTVDFSWELNKKKLTSIGKKQALGKSLGLIRHPNPKVLDATAGLGSDALCMLYLGCEVIMIEQNSALAALLYSAMTQAQSDPKLGEKLRNKLTLHHGRSEDLIAQLAPRYQPDIIYLDPMFPKCNKTAKAKKHLQLLQRILGPAEDSLTLFEQAYQYAKNRVVVKRSKNAPLLVEPSKYLRTHVISGKTIRFDVYLTKNNQKAIEL